jgi:hypothetical protein
VLISVTLSWGCCIGDSHGLGHVARQSQRPSFHVAKQAASWSWATEPIPFCIICYAPHAESALSAADLNLGQCHIIEHRRVVTKGAHQHEAMPNRILKSKPLGKMKYNACRVSHAAGRDQPLSCAIRVQAQPNAASAFSGKEIASGLGSGYRGNWRKIAQIGAIRGSADAQGRIK